MKVLKLEVEAAVQELNCEQRWNAEQDGVKLSALANGGFILTRRGKHFYFPESQVKYAQVEPGTPFVGINEHVAEHQAEQKKAAATVAAAVEEPKPAPVAVPAPAPVKRGPGRPPKHEA